MGAFFSSSFLPQDKHSIIITTSCVFASAIMLHQIHKLPPLIYDKLILNMTEVWYRAVLTRLKKDSKILDIGVGTAGALLRCKDILLSQNISVVGIDYNEFYVKAARKSIEQNNLESSIQIEFKSVYDIDTEILESNTDESFKNDNNSLSIKEPLALAQAQGSLPKTTKKDVNIDTEPLNYFDAAYFSGSISLLPDPPKALQAVASVVKPGGLIYITQTYQRKNIPFLAYIKPLMKFCTSIDFGQLIFVNDVEELLWNGSGLEVIEHKVIPGSIDTRYQAAYLTVLRVPNVVSQ